ncbi:helix-turn-helix domain-containing protein [Rhodococcus erythropolis]|uniref:helix-turn-helix domain-containing protein n=1 Tax=Rhodococcus erythropolis TaxID=1833 RepID=UPI0033B117FA
MDEDDPSEGAIPMGRFDWERIVRRVPMPGSTKFLALTLATYANKDGTRIMPGEQRLARTMGADPRTVQRGFKWLREAEFVVLTKHGNRHKGLANEYQLTVPPDVLERVNLDPDEQELVSEK